MLTEKGIIRTYEEMKMLESMPKAEITYREFVIIAQKILEKAPSRQALMFLYEQYALTGTMPSCSEIKRVALFGKGYYYS